MMLRRVIAVYFDAFNVFVCLRSYADALMYAHAICAVVVGVMRYRSTDHNENTA
jgi:hypothetical protein